MGSIEARDIPKGDVDVIVTEAFVGNVILKLEEGLAKTMISVVKKGMMSSLAGKIGGLLAKPSLKRTLKTFDASEHGGAPLLGLKGPCGEDSRKRYGQGDKKCDPAVCFL